MTWINHALEFCKKKKINVNFLCAFYFFGILMINTLMFSFLFSVEMTLLMLVPVSTTYRVANTCINASLLEHRTKTVRE